MLTVCFCKPDSLHACYASRLYQAPCPDLIPKWDDFFVEGGLHDGGRRSQEDAVHTGIEDGGMALTLAGPQLWRRCSVCRWLLPGRCAPLCHPQLVPRLQEPAALCTPFCVAESPLGNTLILRLVIQAVKTSAVVSSAWQGTRLGNSPMS